MSKNLEKQEIIEKLYKISKQKEKNIYKRVAELLEKSNNNLSNVNLSKIDSLNNIKDESIVIVPTKLLGNGNTNKKIKIYAYSYSDSAKNKFKDIKSLEDFCKDDIDYKKAVIVI